MKSKTVLDLVVCVSRATACAVVSLASLFSLSDFSVLSACVGSLPQSASPKMVALQLGECRRDIDFRQASMQLKIRWQRHRPLVPLTTSMRSAPASSRVSATRQAFSNAAGPR